jgi:hypothetical protein
MAPCRPSYRMSVNHLSNKGSGPRKTVSATASSLLEQEARRLNILEESFYDADNISSLSFADVVEKLQTETARPEGFTVTKLDTELLISDSIPSIRAYITVKDSINRDGLYRPSEYFYVTTVSYCT